MKSFLPWLPSIQEYQTTYKFKKIKNHGGSPPNLGLKEATPELEETRFKWDTFKQHLKKRTNMNTTFLQHIYNSNQGLHNDSQMES